MRLYCRIQFPGGRLLGMTRRRHALAPCRVTDQETDGASSIRTLTKDVHGVRAASYREGTYQEPIQHHRVRAAGGRVPTQRALGAFLPLPPSQVVKPDPSSMATAGTARAAP